MGEGGGGPEVGEEGGRERKRGYPIGLFFGWLVA